MAETPVPITVGNGSASIAGDLVSGNIYQQIKVVDGTLGSNTALKVNADGTIGASVIGTVPVTFVNSSISGTVIVTGLQGASVSGTVQTDVRGSVATVIIGGSIAASFTPPANQSVSGTVQTQVQASVAVVIIGGSILTSSTANQSVSGMVGASIIGQLPAGNAVLGAVAASISGTVPITTTGSVLTLLAPTASLVSGVTSVITGTSSVQVLAPAAGGQRNYITNLLVTNGAAVGTTVQLFDGGNVIYTGYAAASGGGFAAAFPTPLKQASIAGNLSALSTVQASVFVSASGYTAA